MTGRGTYKRRATEQSGDCTGEGGLVALTLASYSRTKGGKSICSGEMAENSWWRLSTWWILSFSPETEKVVKNHVDT